MDQCRYKTIKCKGLPPHGGSGLKSKMKFGRIRKRGLPPHGGSGLKFYLLE